jgi:uncharacterized protein (TIGR03083 family)
MALIPPGQRWQDDSVSLTAGLTPAPDEVGLSSREPAEVRDLLAAAWDGLLDVADGCDPAAPTRLPGWTAREILVHLGQWESDVDPLLALEADARAQVVRNEDDADARNASVLAAHHDAPMDEVLQALAAARERDLRFFELPDAADVGRRWVETSIGPLPLACKVFGHAFELAVHALDLADGLAEQVPESLLDSGVAALVDVTGALAARSGLETTIAVITPQGCWATGTTATAERAWTTVRLDGDIRPSALGWPAVAGQAADVLEAASGRALAVQLLATRRLRVHRPAALIRLLPALESAPGLPGGTAVQASIQALSQAGRWAGRVSGRLSDTMAGGVASMLRRR